MIPTSFPTLSTERLLLKQTTFDDYEALIGLRSDKEVNKYVIRPAATNKKEAQLFIYKISTGFKQKKNIYWGITSKDEQNKMIGSICLWNFSKDYTTAEVGYDLFPTYQNKGIMTEALQTILTYGFQVLNLQKIEAYTHRENIASKRLLTKNNFSLITDKKDADNIHNIVFSIKKTP
ncbi:GNAT family N-acetyltransferase [Aquimarina hainanensis]|uniref:GNAT family N-acetyltransferase n=1 Tax=Aquimarina hainanensis TaxID=1578017 RepID=A0ABW5NAB8_9FLAO|nr:GNAT family N-acetyltransferase [Aquimarina sp. TRL1]QKX03424.1 GNAT family N-acetyltransferase [Aquimarina sp. TRL1]